jgi:hypothetical protein
MLTFPPYTEWITNARDKETRCKVTHELRGVAASAAFVPLAFPVQRTENEKPCAIVNAHRSNRRRTTNASAPGAPGTKREGRALNVSRASVFSVPYGAVTATPFLLLKPKRAVSVPFGFGVTHSKLGISVSCQPFLQALSRNGKNGFRRVHRL